MNGLGEWRISLAFDGEILAFGSLRELFSISISFSCFAWMHKETFKSYDMQIRASEVKPHEMSVREKSKPASQQ